MTKTIVLLGLLVIGFMLLGHAMGGERMACRAEPSDASWHYRTKIPGYAPGVKDDKCWYPGAAMKPREELYWQEPLMTPTIKGAFEEAWSTMMQAIGGR